MTSITPQETSSTISRPRWAATCSQHGLIAATDDYVAATDAAVEHVTVAIDGDSCSTSVDRQGVGCGDTPEDIEPGPYRPGVGTLEQRGAALQAFLRGEGYVQGADGHWVPSQRREDCPSWCAGHPGNAAGDDPLIHWSDIDRDAGSWLVGLDQVAHHPATVRLVIEDDALDLASATRLAQAVQTAVQTADSQGS